ncbi:MAG: hypothetical protein WBE37_09405 [Bryobacteraceae bacterium]
MGAKLGANLGTRILIPLLAASALLRGADPLATGVTRKLDLIQSGQARPGSVIHFTPAELNAWVRAKAPAIVPDGFRAPHLVLGNGEATASAWIDFLKVRRSSGVESSWLVSKLIQGEKFVKVQASIQSAHGQATVHLLRVEVGGLAVTGATLDFLVQNFLLPFYPDAEIDTPFDLADNVDRIEVTPAEARVYIRR